MVVKLVSMLDCQSRSSWFKPWRGQKFGSRFLFHLRSLANSAMTSTLIVHYLGGDDMARQLTDHPQSHAEVKKTKSLTLHTLGCLRATSLSNSSSSFSR